jgi:hypothetical protein
VFASGEEISLRQSVGWECQLCWGFAEQDEKSNRGLEPKKDRPPYPMGVKGGCSPQNNRKAILILRIFRREVSKKDFETE